MASNVVDARMHMHPHASTCIHMHPHAYIQAREQMASTLEKMNTSNEELMQRLLAEQRRSAEQASHHTCDGPQASSRVYMSMHALNALADR